MTRPVRQSPLRVLHVLGALELGGIQVWLVQMAGALCGSELKFELMVLDDRDHPIRRQVEALGIPIHACPGFRNPFRQALGFARFLRSAGPIQAVHCHGEHYSSGLFLCLARFFGVPVRVAHAHSNLAPKLARQRGRAKFRARIYLAILRSLIRFGATVGMAASEDAARSLYGQGWEADPRWHVMPTSLSLTPYHSLADPTKVRASLGLPEKAQVVIHVGRFVPLKNHLFLLEFIQVAMQESADLHLLLVGDGPLRAQVELVIAQSGLGDRIHLLGERHDVANLLGASDLLVFPSEYEGLGLVCLEALAAGVPALISDRIPKEVDVLPAMVQRMSLAESPAAWSRALLDQLQHGPARTRDQCQEAIRGGPFDLAASAPRMAKVYQGRPPEGDLP